ncbi:hypothetical protein [Janthinobacterium sp. J1-1]|uniref:hypothetical protein n=1 Tax=Janthinobacterium sp. J1-1 TaxID=3065910 RepID=UPI0028118E23|nr:hypothetical protein [Janthinobacterium sp. J1-1]
MDQHKLRSHVFDKTGIKIDTDDPIFALVALNEAVLAETIERQLAILNAATDALAAQACAAGGLPPLVKPAIPAAPAPAPAPHASGWTPREWRLLGAAAIVSLASSLLVLGGAALLWR